MTLSCLPHLTKLEYLKLPLHFLMPQVDPGETDENTPPGSIPSPTTAQEVLALVQLTFPPSLKKLDVVVYELFLEEALVGRMYPLRTITINF